MTSRLSSSSKPRPGSSGTQERAVRVFFAACVLTALLSASASLAWAPLQALTNPGDCLVEDASFVSSEGGCTDTASGLTYSASGYLSYFNLLGRYPNLSEATAYCTDLVEGGWDDWRVPTLAELEGLAANGGGTHLNIHAPNGIMRWSSTRRGSKYAYGALIGTGAKYLFTVRSQIDVVCVR